MDINLFDIFPPCSKHTHTYPIILVIFWSHSGNILVLMTLQGVIETVVNALPSFWTERQAGTKHYSASLPNLLSPSGTMRLAAFCQSQNNYTR